MGFDTFRQVSREGFESLEKARESARKFVRSGGKVVEGGERADGTFGYSGTFEVRDDDYRFAGSFGCRRCAFTGAFITYTENSVPKGPGGICFRCNGKGFHMKADRARNATRDRHAMLRAARNMAAGR